MIRRLARIVADLAPDSWQRDAIGPLDLWQVIGLTCVILGAWGLGALAARAATRVGHKVARHTSWESDDVLMLGLRSPATLTFSLVLTWLGLYRLDLSNETLARSGAALAMGLTFALAWGVVRVVDFIGEILVERATKRVARGGDTIRLRGVKTQVRVLKRVTKITVGIVTIAIMLLQFEVVRSVGLSLLASAGVAGIVIGLAAQKSIATLLGGIQLSVTQPVRIGDQVLVENEWGTIEEINLTYVVVRVWDQRRLIVPMSHFLEQPFQNWTKFSPELIGSVVLSVDHRLPVDRLRQALDVAVEGHPLFDGRVKVVQVLEMKEHTTEVRCLVSAVDAPTLWDLRCDVREKLIAWLQETEGGRYLPRTRLSFEEPAQAPARSA